MAKFLTRAELFARGWNNSLIRRHLPEPDELMRGENDNRAQRPSYLYRVERVERVELTPAFQRDLSRSKVLSRRATSIAKEKKDHLEKVVDSAIFLPLEITFDEAMTQAESKGPSDLAGLRQLALEILCANLKSDECATIESFEWHSGIKGARVRYKKRKLFHIVSLYPELKKEVDEMLSKMR